MRTRVAPWLVLCTSLALASACTGSSPSVTDSAIDALDASTTLDATTNVHDGFDGGLAEGGGPIHVIISTASTVATVSDRFLSFAVDTSQVVGGHFWAADAGPSDALVGSMRVAPYDFTRPKLRRMAQELSPAYLRIGGTEADDVYYDLADPPMSATPAPYTLSMTAAQWDSANQFAMDLGLQVMFTLNAGPSSRNASGQWVSNNAQALLSHTAAHQYPVAVWELGNEIDGYLETFGVTVTGAQYAMDMMQLRTVATATTPGVLLAGPSSAYWPLLGEVGPVLLPFLNTVGTAVDIVTWHFYPMESVRCPVALRAANLTNALAPQTLNEIQRWATQVEGDRDADVPAAPVWLGETGNAQCGGQPGISDAFVGGFWWIDELGTMARHGEPVVVRQTLSGSNYGLIDDDTLTPNPDYWNSVLWHRLMDVRVLTATTSTASSPIRAYAHCARGVSGGVTLVALNIDPVNSQVLQIDTALGDESEVYLATASSLMSQTVLLNGTPLAVADDGSPPTLSPLMVSGSDAISTLTLPAASYAFVQFPHAAATACP